MSNIVFSAIIPAKSLDDQKLKDLLASIRAQDFPQDQIETIVVTEGDSEQAKAIGIRRAKGEICAMFCADNMIMEKDLFSRVHNQLKGYASAAYPSRYFYNKDDNSLNRYFSLIGGNDPVCYYLGKNDRDPHVYSLKRYSNYTPSYGCNGFFYKSELIKKTDLDHYYPMDNAMEVPGYFTDLDSQAIWHRTSDKLIPFLIKRYKYARDLYCNRRDRRWKMVETTQDYVNLWIFIASTLSVIPCLFVSLRGFIKVRDWAWAWHWPVCVGFLITYGVLACRTLLSRLSSRRLGVVKSLTSVFSPLPSKPTPTTR